MRIKNIYTIILTVGALLLTSCRDGDIIYYPMDEETHEWSGDDTDKASEVVGLYILNEGNMGSNKATLDYLDFSSGIYSRNIYPSRNPSKTMSLGDVGNDIKIYGSKLWMVINCSNKVEVCDAATAVSQGQVNIPNCRYLAFDKGYAYVSSYVGEVNAKSVLGSVYKVDTTTLSIVGQVSVGYQPDELAVTGGKLYVANSGGYNAMEGLGYDRRVTEIDLDRFEVTRYIDVAPNLFRIRADRYGRLWVASRGDDGAYPSRLYVLEKSGTGEMLLTDSLDVPASDLAMNGDSLYFYGSKKVDGKTQRYYGIVNMLTLQVVNTSMITLPEGVQIRTPYGMLVHPQTGDIYVMDATNYVSSGKLFCFDKYGEYKWDVKTGDIPGHGVFLKIIKTY